MVTKIMVKSAVSEPRAPGDTEKPRMINDPTSIPNAAQKQILSHLPLRTPPLRLYRQSKTAPIIAQRKNNGKMLTGGGVCIAKPLQKRCTTVPKVEIPRFPCAPDTGPTRARSLRGFFNFGRR